MPSHIKHMDKMCNISVISNTPLSQLSVGITFIAQNFILKNSKISLSRVELPNAFSIDFLFIFFNSKTLIPLEIIASAMAQKK